MQVSSTNINTNNYQQHAQKPASKPSFKSIIPTDIVVDGVKTIENADILPLVRQLRKDLANPVSEAARNIKKMFFANNKTFADFCERTKRFSAIWYEIVDGNVYIFNGKHAEELDTLRKSVEKSGRHDLYQRRVNEFVYDKRNHSHLHSPKGDVELSLTINAGRAQAGKSLPIADSVEFSPIGAKTPSRAIEVVYKKEPESAPKPTPKPSPKLIADSSVKKGISIKRREPKASLQTELFG